MTKLGFLTMSACLFFSIQASAQEDVIANAMSAGPDSISKDATIMDWDDNVLREGTNGWTCLPDRQETPGNDPWCVNEPWMNFLSAYKSKTEPTYTGFGIAYTLEGDTPVSNTDPYATEKTNDADCVEDLAAHLIVLLPGREQLNAFSRDSNNGGPWVMWPDTSYAHLMVPIEGAPK